MAPRKSPDDTYIAAQPAGQRPLLAKLQALVVKGVPGAEVAIKWGVPVYSKNGKAICAIAAFKENVALNIFASPDVLVDPGKKLEGAGKTSRMLKVRSDADIDKAGIARWLKAAVASKS